MNSKLLILFGCFFLCHLKGNGTNDPALTPPEVPTQWTIVINAPTKLDTSYMKVIGEFAPSEKDEILTKVSEIKGIYPVISEIKALGDEFYIPAVRVTASERFTVYLVRLKNGHWVISAVILRWS